jgi:hypothetical protein
MAPHARTWALGPSIVSTRGYGKLTSAEKTARADYEAIQSLRQVQKFLSIHDQVANLFHIARNKLSANEYRATRA